MLEYLHVGSELSDIPTIVIHYGPSCPVYTDRPVRYGPSSPRAALSTGWVVHGLNCPRLNYYYQV